jgi:hypothetical protein
MPKNLFLTSLVVIPSLLGFMFLLHLLSPIKDVITLLFFLWVSSPAYYKWDTALLLTISVVIFILSWPICEFNIVVGMIVWLIAIALWAITCLYSMANEKGNFWYKSI